MCTIAVKKLPSYGWVGVKNRDLMTLSEPALSEINDSYLLIDNETGYCEGLGKVAILTNSLGKPTHEYEEVNGNAILAALHCNTVHEALELLIRRMPSMIVGFVFDENVCYKFESDGKVFLSEEVISQAAATNHGTLVNVQAMNQRYSIKRMQQTRNKIQSVRTPNELLEAITTNEVKYDRIEREGGTYTVGQVLIVPSREQLKYRPMLADAVFEGIERIETPSLITKLRGLVSIQVEQSQLNETF